MFRKDILLRHSRLLYAVRELLYISWGCSDHGDGQLSKLSIGLEPMDDKKNGGLLVGDRGVFEPYHTCSDWYLGLDVDLDFHFKSKVSDPCLGSEKVVMLHFVLTNLGGDGLYDFEGGERGDDVGQ